MSIMSIKTQKKKEYFMQVQDKIFWQMLYSIVKVIYHINWFFLRTNKLPYEVV